MSIHNTIYSNHPLDLVVELGDGKAVDKALALDHIVVAHKVEVPHREAVAVPHKVVVVLHKVVVVPHKVVASHKVVVVGEDKVVLLRKVALRIAGVLVAHMGERTVVEEARCVVDKPF